MIAASFLPGRWKKILLTHGPFICHFTSGSSHCRGFWRSAPGDRPKRILLATLLIGLALTLEGVQGVIYPIRFFEWRDFVTDSGGVLAALYFTSVRLSRA